MAVILKFTLNYQGENIEFESGDELENWVKDLFDTGELDTDDIDSITNERGIPFALEWKCELIPLRLC